MTAPFIDQVILNSNNSAPHLSPTQTVSGIWGFLDGNWHTTTFNQGNSFLTFTNGITNGVITNPINLFEIINNTTFEPSLVIDRSFIVKKDFTAGGFLSTNQGALWIGSGLHNQLSTARIILRNSEVSMLDGNANFNVPAIPRGQTGSSFPLYPTSGTYYLRTDADPQYHNKVFRYIGPGWFATTPAEHAKQLFIATNSFLGQPANTIFESRYNTGTQKWEWTPIGPVSNYTGKYFDTLYLMKFDQQTSADLDLGNLISHGFVRTAHLESQSNTGNNTIGLYSHLVPYNPNSNSISFNLGSSTYPFENLYTKKIDATGLIHAGGSSGPAFQVGDDIYIVDYNQANRLSLRGVQNSNEAGVQFGNGGPTLYRLNNYLICETPTHSSGGFSTNGSLYWCNCF